MGKVKIKVIGDEQQEQQEIEKNKAKREQKDLREGKKSTHVSGMKGGERTTTVGVSEEEIAAQLDVSPADDQTSQKENKKEKAEKKARIISKRHTENKKITDTTPLNMTKSIEKLRKFKPSSFDETVELHINTREKGISGTVVLPHGTGKKLNIKIADDLLIAEIEKGKISFDILVAHPSVMPKLAKVAKILGPRGLMPNPKNGTISTEPEKAAEKLSAGQIGYKTESTAPIIHLSVGKLSFDDKKIADNVTTVLSTIGNSKINSVTLKSTMSPAIKISL